MAQSIEIPVSLGLQNAQAQVTELRKMLQNSVNVKSDAFKDIQRFLDKISGQADTLKGKMGEAFKTPNGSKNFLKQYEQLMGMLEAAKDRFTNLGLNDIAFSSEDQTAVNNMLEKIKNLQAEIANLEKGKIGNLFDDKSIQGADQVTAFIEQLKNAGQDVSKLTFSGLSAAINKELTQVNTSIQQTTEKINGFKQQINILSGASLDNITTKMEQALTSSTDSSKSTFKTEKLIEYRNAIAEFYKSWDQLGIQHSNKNDATGNIGTWLQRESQNIANGAENLKAQLPKCQAALQQLQDIKNDPALKGDEAKGRVQNIAESLGLTDFNADSFRNYTSAIAELRRKIQDELMHGFTSDKEVDQYAQQMIANLGQVFENIDINKVVNVTNLRNQLKAIFTEAGLDLKDSDLSRIINSLGENMDFSAFMSNAKQAFQDFIKNRQEMVNESEKQNEALKQQQTDLQTASNTVQIQDNIKTDSIKQKEAEIQQFTQSLQELINKYNEANGTHLRVIDDSQFKNGQNAINSYIDSLTKLQQKQKTLSNVQMAVNRWMGFWQVLNMTKSAINDMKQHLQELDTVMTSISVVTNFSQNDLWGQISQYSEIARQYGVAIKGVYEVSQIYYQQGLQQNDVMTLTTETLKMARIAGLDYATAADYMTTAIRGFKLEMTDAAHVTDVFSALAATTASSTEEIAVAISKTAASAEAVGASFEATSAMMATMIATTRESATNIGTALKSVISRYGEMTSDPSKTVDSEGEEMSLNRVDKALQTVGITIHDTAGQFRDFDDVMLELMEKWDSLDSLSQRYIATLMAGNRQQSRFLALVSNVDEYKKALQTAVDSEGTGELQTLKTLDSIDAKIEKMKVTIQEFYTSSGLEELYKTVIDTITNIISAANGLPKIFNKFPAQALAVGMSLVTTVKSVLTLIIAQIQLGLEKAKGTNTNFLVGLVQQYTQKGREAGQQFSDGVNSGLKGFVHSKAFVQIANIVGSAMQLIGSDIFTQGLSQYGASTSHDEDVAAVGQMRKGAVVSALGGVASGAAMGFAAAGPLGALAGGVTSLVTQIPTLITAFGTNTETLARKIELDKKAETKAKEELSKDKGEVKSLEKALDELEKLKDAQYDSAEAAKEYTDYMNQLGDQYPNLIDSINQTGDAIINVTSLELALAEARGNAASSTVGALKAEQKRLQDEQEAARLLGDFDILGQNTDYSDLLLEYFGEAAAKNAGGQRYQMASLVTAYLEDMNLTGKKEKLYNGVRQQNPQSEENAQRYLSVPQQRLGVMNWAIEHYEPSDMSMDSAILEPLQSLLYGKVKDYITAIPESKLLAFLDLDSVDQINQMNGSQLLDLAKKVQQYSTDIFDSTAQTLETVGTALLNAEISSKIQSKLNTMVTSGSQKEKDNAATLQNYITLMSFIYSSMDNYEDYMGSLEGWILQHQSEAQKLLALDYSTFKTSSEIDFGTLPEVFRGAFIEEFEQIRSEAVTLYNNLLNSIFGQENQPDWLAAGQFTNKTLTVIQSDLKQYQSFIEKQQYAQAEAYLDNMEAIYGSKGIGGLSGENQTKAYDIIKDLDLSDPEALHSAAESFAGMGSGFEGLSEIFTNAALRWTTNAATLLEQLASTTKDTAKSIESSLSDMSKVFKYSEALEKAQALMDANEGVEFKELFTYDKDLGGYVKTAKAFQLEMAELGNEQYAAIDRYIQDIDVFDQKKGSLLKSWTAVDGKQWDMKSLVDQFTDEASQGTLQKKFAELLGLDQDSEQFDRLWQEYHKMVDGFNALEDPNKDWATFVNDYIKTKGSDLAKQLEEIQQMPQKMAQEALKSFDYASIAGGKWTTQSKETLEALIQSSLKEGTQFDFNTFWTNLITGQIDSANEALKTAGLEQISTGQVNRARFESLTSLYQKIASGDVIWDALTQQEQTLLNSVEGVNLTEGASAAQVGAAADNLWKAILTLIAKGAGTINEVADSLQKRAEQDYLATNAGKQYDLLTKLQDGFTAEELTSFKDKDNKGIFVDDQGNLISGFEDYFEFKDNKWMMKAGEDAATVIEYLRQKLGISIDKATEEYKKIISDSIDDEIKLADEADIGKQRVDKLSKVMSGKVTDRISLAGYDDVDKAYLEAAGLISDKSANFVYIQSEEQLSNAIKYFDSLLSNETWTQNNPQTARYFQQLVSDFESKTAKNAAFEGIVGEQFNQSAAEALSMALQNTTEYSKVQSLMTEMGFKWDQAAQTWKASAESIKATREKINTAYGTGKIDREEFLHLQAQLDATAKAIDPKTKQDNALLEILQNYNAVTDEMLATFATEFHIPRNSIKNFIKANDNGTYDIDLGALTSYLNSIGFEYDEAAMSQIQTITDSYLNNIKTATTYTTQGASSLADVDAFKQSYADIVGKTLSNDAFSYNSVLQSFVLDESYMDEYINAQREKLRQLNYSEEFIEQYIKDQTDRAIQDSIALDGFLNATTTTERNDEANKLIQQIRSLSNYAEIVDTAAPERYWKTWSEISQELQDAQDQAILRVLESGGQNAVNLLKQIKPDASSDELEAAFNSQINKLTDVLGQVGDLVSGEFVGIEGKLYEVLARADAVDDNGVVKAGFDMVEVYAAIYAEMSQTAGATTAGLNDAYAQLLTAQDQTNIDITEALKNGNGMSYADFGNLLAKYDIKFEDYMTQHYDAVMRDGFGNIRITDWNAFAKSIWGDNLDQVKNTQEYTSAFKAYNDGLIELNKNTEDAIVEEIKQIENAKAGDWLNLSQLWTAIKEAFPSDDWTTYMGKAQGNQTYAKTMQNQDWYQSVVGKLNLWGASLEDGILKIGDNANLLGIAQTLEEAAQQAGLELGNGLEEVKDAVLNVLKSYTDAITNGIEGGLSNTDASNLIKMADNLGVKNLHFEQTAEGLKLSEQSAIALYQALSQVDALQGKIVFDKLADSLKESNENYSTTAALLNRIKTLTLAIKTGVEEINGVDQKISSARLEQYKAELDVAKEIATVRSTTEDDSFNFMDNDIPGGQKNMINYAKNWTEAMKAINDAYKVKNTKYRDATKNTATGYMDYTDFYNIVNELNNMAGLMHDTVTIGHTIKGDAVELDGTLESASKVITQGIETITAVDTGDMMVNIGALGINLSKGANELNSGIQDGIKAVAQAQISALDGLIAMLELIVAMEQLGDITGEDTTIDLGDIFAVDGVEAGLDQIDEINGFTDKFNESREKLLQSITGTAVEDVFKSTKVKIGDQMRSMYEMLDFDYDTLFGGLTGKQKEQAVKSYQGLLDGLYQAAISGNYNLDDIAGSLQEILNSTGYDFDESFMLNVGKKTYTVQSGVVVEAVDWEKDTAQEVLKQYKDQHKKENLTDDEAQTRIVEAIQNYLNGEGVSNDLTVTQILKLRHNTKIQSDKKGNYVTDSKGNKHYEKDNDNFWQETIGKEILKDQAGIDAADMKTWNAQDKSVTVSYGQKLSISMKAKVNTETGEVTWDLDGDYSSIPGLENWKPSGKAKTQNELLEEMYTHAKDNTLDENGNQIEFPTKESWIYQTFGIHVKTQTTVYQVQDDNTQIEIEDPTKNQKFRDAAKAALENQEWGIETNGEGKATINFGGYVIETDEDDITVNGEHNDAAIAAKIREAMGIDEALKDTISTAITESLSALPQAINSIEPSNITSVSEALNGIITALSAVVGDSNWDTLIAKLQEVASAASGIKLPTDGSESETPASNRTKKKFKDFAEKIKQSKQQETPAEDSSSYRVKTKDGNQEEAAANNVEAGIDKVKTALANGQQTLAMAGTNIGTTVTESLSSAATAGLNTLSEGITEAVDSVIKSYTDLETRTEQVAGTIRSHWEALVIQITDAVTLIQTLVQSLQEKISITWTIGSEGGKSDLSSSGSGVNLDPTRGATALTEYMDKMLSTMEHNKENDTFKVTMPTLTIDTSTTDVNIDDIGKKVQEEAAKEPVKEVKVSVGAITSDLTNANVDVANINEKVKTETKANPISSLDTVVNSITPDLTGTTVDTAGINKKVQTEVTKNPISNLNVAVSAITPDVSEATPADIEVFPKPLIIKSAKAKIEKLADPLDLTEINDLGVQTLNENASMVLTDVKAVPTSLSLSLDSTSNVSIDESTPVVLSKPVKIPAEVDTQDAENDIDTLKTKIGEIKQESKPKIFVDINPALRILTALHKAIDEVKQKKAPQITVDTEVAKTNLDEIINRISTIIEKAQSLMIRITTAQETYQTSELIKTIMNNLTTIETKKTQTITMNGGNWDKLISDLQKIAKALERIQGASGINIDVNGGPKETPEGGETPKEEETPKEGETSKENNTPTQETPSEQEDKVSTKEATAETLTAKEGKVDGETTAETLNAPEGQVDQVSGETADIKDGTVQTTTAENVDVPEGTKVAIEAAIDLGEAGQNLTLTATIEVEMPTLPAEVNNKEVTWTVNVDADEVPAPPSSTSVTWTINVEYRRSNNGVSLGPDTIAATGNLGLASGTLGLASGTLGRITGPAHAQSTLMGELGPELVVSNGHYFVAGQNGAEMVNLDKDAIVFNHLQTEQLLKHGMSKERGRAVTNERNAVAFAKGNIGGGPAMASASAALAALKQIRSMWQSLLNASVKDLAGAGGSGGGGGGGDKGKGGKDSGNKSFIEDVERWYNLMQEIAKLEKVINHEETLRAKLEGDLHKNGSAYYKSQKESLAAIQNEIKAQEELNISRREYFNQRRKQLNQDNGPFSQLYEFDPQGQLKYKDNTTIKGSKATNGYAFLADLMAQDPNTGKPKYTVEQQYKILKKAGFAKYMKYDSSGNEIKLGGTDSDDGPSKDDYNTYYSSMVQAFWDRVEAQKSEMQTLYDSVAEGENSLLEKEQARNELLEAMYDNQKELENSVLSAIEDMKQREIDALQDERDKLEEATGKYIDGLSEALDKERQMYDTQENQNELDTKKRRLGILQRSGASAEDIYSLQKEITESEKNMYFDAQQAQIDAIQQASDLEIERLDTQIQIMQDTLDFQKEMGLLWYQVYDVMGKSSAEITQFIMGNDSQFWNKSPLESAQTYEKTLFEADQWKSFATDTQNFIQWTRDSQTADALSTYSQTMGEQHKKDDFWKNNKERYESEFTRVFEDTGDRTKAATAASKMFETDKAWNDRETTAGDRFVSDKETEYVDLNDTYHWVYTYEKEKYTGLNEKYKDQEQLYFKSREKEKHVWGSDGLCTKCGHKKPKKKKTSSGGGGDSSFIPPYGCGQSCAQYCKGKLSGGTSSSKSSSSTKKSSTTIPSNTVESIKEPATSTKKNTSLGNYQSVYTQDDKKKTKGQASGGYVGHGIYELGERGTETVLTAQQTRVLRNNILSNKPSSLVSLLKTYNEGFSMNQRYGLLKSIGERMSSTTNNTSGGITIENATVNMNVQKIANDYDAKRAGEQALNEMLRIANKTSAANNIRR